MPMLFHDDQTWMKVLVSPVCFFGVSALWVLGVFALVNVMLTRKAVNVKSFMRVYNVCQIVVCSYMVWGLLPCIGIPNFFGINSEYDRRGEWFVFVHYLTKYMDWFDTLFICLNKKRSQLSFLHIFHHGTIVAVWGMLLHNGAAGGTVRYGAWINSLTHVIMYSHYLWTSYGLKNPFKKVVTMWQIGQFYSCFVHAFAVQFFDRTQAQDLAWVQILYQLVMIFLFSSQMSWVPSCVPDFTGSRDEVPTSCANFCNPQDGDESFEPHPSKATAWSKRYVMIRGQAYDLTKFNHPGGEHMIDLAVGRDATVMFESAHIRLELAEKMLATLPQPCTKELEAKGFDFGRKETWATPAQSELHTTLRKRIYEEVLKPRGMGERDRRGVPAWHFLTVIASWLIAAAWFVTRPSIISGLVLGWTLAWIGTGVQHTANHGGLTANRKLNYVLGLLNDVALGASSINWRYHHQVSHHAYCNDVVLDTDVHSSYPIVRLDSSQAWHPYHKFQFIYAPIAFCFLWISTQLQDLDCLLEARFFLVKYKGTQPTEIVFAVFLKVVHFWWIVVLPYQVHGLSVMLVPWMFCFGFGGWLLSTMFIVSHNVDETKTREATKPDDWARLQIETSTSWGGAIGSFFSGGLNLQIEHHLFPCMSHHLYQLVQPIVMEECAKRKLAYNAYPYLWPNLLEHFKFLYHMGQPPLQKQQEAKKVQ